MRKFHGFTLIEMLIVISIIGVLSAALIPRITSAKDRAINIVTIKHIRDITNALTMFYSETNRYPDALTCKDGTKSDCSLSSVQGVLSKYLSPLPTTSYNISSREFGSGYQVPQANQFGYVGFGNRYILSYYLIDTRDSKRYRIVNMPDNQRWMAENLNHKTSNSMCYDNTDAGCENGYGRNYSRDDAQTACPIGRHLPAESERATMLDKVDALYGGAQNNSTPSLDTTESLNNVYGSVAGNHLRASSAGGLDSFGLSLLIGGYVNSEGISNNREGSFPEGYYLSAGEKLGGGISRLLRTDGSQIFNVLYNKTKKFSVRCIRNLQ